MPRTSSLPARLLAVLVSALVPVAACSATSHTSAAYRAAASRSTAFRAAAAAAPAARPSCYGAAAVTRSACKSVRSGRVSPSLAKAPTDNSQIYRGDSSHTDCRARAPKFPVTVCSFDAKTSATRVALVGNSHAAEWLPALQKIADKRHYHVISYVASACVFADVDQAWPTRIARLSCHAWERSVLRRIIKGHYSAVVMSDKITFTAYGSGRNAARSHALYQSGYERVLRAFAAAKVSVLVLRDTPAPGFRIPQCLAAHRTNYPACNGRRATWLSFDPTVAAVAAVHSPQVRLLDLTNHICHPVVCQAVIGGVVGYYDYSHLTATFNRTLTPWLEPPLVKMIAG